MKAQQRDREFLRYFASVLEREARRFKGDRFHGWLIRTAKKARREAGRKTKRAKR